MKNTLSIFIALLIFGQIYAQNSYETKALEQQTDNLLHITGCKMKHYYEPMCQLYTYGPHQFLRCDGGDFMIGCPVSYLVRQDSLGTHRSYHAIYFQSPDSKITIIPANYAAVFDKEIGSVYQFERQRWQDEGWELLNTSLQRGFYLIEACKNGIRLYIMVICRQDTDCLSLTEVIVYYFNDNVLDAQRIIKTYISKFPNQPF